MSDTKAVLLSIILAPNDDGYLASCFLKDPCGKP